MNPRHFHNTASARLTPRVAICALLMAALIAPVMAVDVALSDDLVPTKARYFDKAWQKPGSDFGGYTALFIRPAKVEFSKNWRPRDYGSFGLKPDEVERIRSTYAKAADQAFARVLSKGGRNVVAAPGEKVLEVQAEVLDLYVNGPEVTSDALVRTYVRSAGDMRLLLTLRDSTTGAVLFRGSDFKRGDETGRLEWASSIYNRVEAERAFTGWAKQVNALLGKQEASIRP
jgi:hypothetical protein